MAIKYGKKQRRSNNIVFALITALLLCAIFVTMVSSFYKNAEEEAYETLHIQTKQIKDDLELQLLSDRENLITMASFAAKLYKDGESFDLLFSSFKSIGLIENIGILTPDNRFSTKTGEIDLNGKISFAEEVKKGSYISGRIKDLTRDNYEIIRSAVPIVAKGETIGILYGVIKLDAIGGKYGKMAEELDAQLFLYDRETGDLVIDTIRDSLGNISFLKDREYARGFSYQEMFNAEKGYTSFKSAYTGEQLYVHYSSLEEVNWKITLARYESQVFAKVHKISQMLLVAFTLMIAIVLLYVFYLMRCEKQRRRITECASKIRKTLLEFNQQQSSLYNALQRLGSFAKSRSAIFFNADGDDYNYVMPGFDKELLKGEDRIYFVTELIRYAGELHGIDNATVSLMKIKPNAHLLKTNKKFYDFLTHHKIFDASFASVIDKNNHISILGVINPKNGDGARTLMEDIVVCFSIALFNKNHLDKTEIAATTDALTGVSNRVAYKKDILEIDAERANDFSCVYVDVNELHLVNNKHGHAAGDEMLLYIANTLKEVFYGHSVYRMGGDEFLVFAKGTPQSEIKRCIDFVEQQLLPRNYHIAVGMSFRTRNLNTEEMVREAEIRMYEAKAQYYQNKEGKKLKSSNDCGYVHTRTGIVEIDTLISILNESYNGIYRVGLDTDKAHRILMPAYLGYSEHEEHFSNLLTRYIDESVAPEFHRSVMAFLNYDALKRQIIDGKIPRITYKKTDGQTVVLSVYKLADDESNINDTLWVFAKA